MLEQVDDKVAEHVHDVWVALHVYHIQELDNHAVVLWFDVLDQAVVLLFDVLEQVDDELLADGEQVVEELLAHGEQVVDELLVHGEQVVAVDNLACKMFLIVVPKVVVLDYFEYSDFDVYSPCAFSQPTYDDSHNYNMNIYG